MGFISSVSHKLLALACLFLCVLSVSYSQVQDSSTTGNYHSLSFNIGAKDTSVQLPSQFVVEGTDSVWIDSTMLQRGSEYLLDSRTGIITLRRQAIETRLKLDTANHKLFVDYSALPFIFKDKYRHHEPVMVKDTLTGKEVRLSKPVTPFTLDDIFGSNVQKSGSILRGLSVGSNRDLTLSSGFNMQMSGKIASNLEVIAALTDENIPLQPEGTTQQLQEIDKVYVEIRGTDARATLGDFSLGLYGNEFGGYNRKMEGAEGIAEYRTDITHGEVIVSAGTTRGKFTTNQFNGLDAVQGPYNLSGQNGERNIIVIAGTEHVYVDGQQMVRGEINDYTIDYSNAQVTFTAKRLITQVSRITVDFEYNDQQFNRNMFAVKTTNSFLNDRLTVHGTVIHESDDESSPIGVTLSDTDRAILQNAGANALQANRSGIDSVGIGKGQYERFDTLAYSPVHKDSEHVAAYRYAPEDTLNAIFAITFSFVGQGQGDYAKVAVGQYQFVGIDQGAYSPIQLLPVPQSHTLTDFDALYKLTDNLSVIGEGALSNFNQNKFSTLPGVQINGGAYDFGLKFAPDSVMVGGKNYGRMQIGLSDRFVGGDFQPIDRINSIEFNREWNVEDSTSADELIRQGTIEYQPVKSFDLSGSAGQITRGNFFTTNRYTAGGKYFSSGMPGASYNIEILKSQDNLDTSTTNWYRDSAVVSDSLGKFIPTVQYHHEYRSESSTAGSLTDSAFGGTFRYVEVMPGLMMRNILGMSLLSEYGWRGDDSLYQGTLQRADQSFTQHYTLTLPQAESFSSSLSVTSRHKSYTEPFKTRDSADVNTFLLQWNARYSPLNHGIETEWFYDAASERSAKYQRIFESVPIGTGNYVYVGDVNHNHIVDEPDFQLTNYDGTYIAVLVPSDQFIPVTDLKASGRVRITASRLFSTSNSFGSIVSPLSTETYLRVAEKSTDPNTQDVYLLHLNSFLNPLNTLDGTDEITQDVYLWENSALFSARLRYDQQKGYTQYSLQDERTYSREQSIRLKWHLVPEIANELDASHKIDDLSSTEFSSRVRGIVADAFSFDWSYRPVQSIELGFKIGVGRSVNFDTTTANLDDQTLRFVYSLENKGQLRVEFSREEAILTKAGEIFPYELTGGEVAGRTWLWHLAFDYKITQFIQSSIAYEGRIENGGGIIHTGRAEVKAFF